MNLASTKPDSPRCTPCGLCRLEGGPGYLRYLAEKSGCGVWAVFLQICMEHSLGMEGSSGNVWGMPMAKANKNEEKPPALMELTF